MPQSACHAGAKCARASFLVYSISVHMTEIHETNEMQSWSHDGGRTPWITFHGLQLDLPEGEGLIITRHRGPYWFFHLPSKLLTHRRLDQLGDWGISTPFWQLEAMRPGWKAMRETWREYLEWCDAQELSPDIFVCRYEVHVDWVSLPRRYCGGLRWQSAPRFVELERRTAEVVHWLTTQ
jgi:hypothetical protein